jgi:Protein of unknown function (DUF4031)
MTVYVDNARIPAKVGRVSGRWSHLTADAKPELHEFAARIGLQPAWFQTCKNQAACPPETCPHWHFDVTDVKRAAAVAAGAVEIDIRQWSDIIRGRREAQRAAVGKG